MQSLAPGWRRIAGALSSLLVAAALVLTFSTCAQAAAAWTAQTSPTTVNLLGLSCVANSTCGGAGAISGGNGEIAHTSNGTSWTGASPFGGQQLNAISCANATSCWMAGNAGLLLFTNGTTTLTQETSPTTVALLGISCPDTLHCFAVGAVHSGNGAIIATTNGGTSWAYQTAAGGQQLNAVSCTSATSCWAVGNGGVIIHTANGSTWTAQTSTTTVNLLGVACPSATTCWAVGAKSGTNGVIDATIDGGTTWATQTSTGAQQLNALSCPDTTHCWAVGNAGLVLVTSNGTSWSAQTSSTTSALDGVSFINDGAGWAVGAGGVITTYGCRSGGLSVTPPASLTWPSTALNGKNQLLTLSPLIAVDDETASGAGWNLTATSTTFTSVSAKTLPTTAATLSAVSAVAGTGNCTMPTNVISYPVAIPAAATAPTAVKIFDAAAATGSGPINLTLSLGLTLPARTVVGAYSSTWTFTVASGP